MSVIGRAFAGVIGLMLRASGLLVFLIARPLNWELAGLAVAAVDLGADLLGGVSVADGQFARWRGSIYHLDNDSASAQRFAAGDSGLRPAFIPEPVVRSARASPFCAPPASPAAVGEARRSAGRSKA